MKRYWTIGGSCLLIAIVILGALVWRQHRPTTAPTQTAEHASHVADRPAKHHTAAAKSVSWQKCRHPLRLPVLMYHSISTGNQLRVPAKQFIREMAYLKKHHYRTLTTAEAIRALTTNTVPQRKVVWITLDDAYRDNLTRALPILRHNQLHATINVITGFTHKANHLSLAEMDRMQATGAVDFASHTVHHLNLNELSEKQQRTELVASKNWLDQHLHQQTRLLVYPAGRADATTRRLAKQAGYQLALTTQEGRTQLSQGRYNLARLRITPGMPLSTFADLVKPID